MKRLVEAFSGSWAIVLKVEPQENLPNGGKGKGKEVWRPGPGGLSYACLPAAVHLAGYVG